MKPTTIAAASTTSRVFIPAIARSPSRASTDTRASGRRPRVAPPRTSRDRAARQPRSPPQEAPAPGPPARPFVPPRTPGAGRQPRVAAPLAAPRPPRPLPRPYPHPPPPRPLSVTTSPTTPSRWRRTPPGSRHGGSSGPRPTRITDAVLDASIASGADAPQTSLAVRRCWPRATPRRPPSAWPLARSTGCWRSARPAARPPCRTRPPGPAPRRREQEERRGARRDLVRACLMKLSSMPMSAKCPISAPVAAPTARPKKRDEEEQAEEHAPERAAERARAGRAGELAGLRLLRPRRPGDDRRVEHRDQLLPLQPLQRPTIRSAPSTVSNLIAVNVAIGSSSPAAPGAMRCGGGRPPRVSRREPNRRAGMGTMVGVGLPGVPRRRTRPSCHVLRCDDTAVRPGRCGAYVFARAASRSATTSSAAAAPSAAPPRAASRSPSVASRPRRGVERRRVGQFPGTRDRQVHPGRRQLVAPRGQRTGRGQARDPFGHLARAQIGDVRRRSPPAPSPAPAWRSPGARSRPPGCPAAPPGRRGAAPGSASAGRSTIAPAACSSPDSRASCIPRSRSPRLITPTSAPRVSMSSASGQQLPRPAPRPAPRRRRPPRSAGRAGRRPARRRRRASGRSPRPP